MATKPRITDDQLWDMFTEVSHLLSLPETVRTHTAPTLHVGDHLNKISNKLIVDTMQLWYDGMAGITKRDCYNALRIMKSTLSLVAERQVKYNMSKAQRDSEAAYEHAVTSGEKLFLVCNNCGEAFDDMAAAQSHGTFIPGINPYWCGEEGFAILSESEAM